MIFLDMFETELSLSKGSPRHRYIYVPKILDIKSFKLLHTETISMMHNGADVRAIH